MISSKEPPDFITSLIHSWNKARNRAEAMHRARNYEIKIGEASVFSVVDV
jgi:hypothetical protein